MSETPNVVATGDSPQPSGSAQAGPVVVTVAEAQAELGRALDAATRGQDVVITRHDAPPAVLMSAERYRRLVGAEAALSGTLTREFDDLLTRMQMPEVRAATERGFSASPKEMGRAAEAAARGVEARSGHAAG